MSSEGGYTAGTQVLFINSNEARDQGQVQAYQGGQFDNADNEEADPATWPAGNRKSHKQAEKARRDRMNQRLDFLRKIVPDAQALTKVKLLDVTIEYIAHLKERLGLRSPMDDTILQQLTDDKVRYVEGRQSGDAPPNDAPPTQPMGLSTYGTQHVAPPRQSTPSSTPAQQLVYVNEASGQQYTITSSGQTMILPPMSDAPVDPNFPIASGSTSAAGGTSSPIQLIVQLPPNTDIKTLLDQHGGNLGITLNGRETIITAGPGGLPEGEGGPGGDQAVAVAGGQPLQSLPIAQMINVSGGMMAMEMADGTAGNGELLGAAPTDDARQGDAVSMNKRVKLEDGTAAPGPGMDAAPPPDALQFDPSIPHGSSSVAIGQHPPSTSADLLSHPNTFLPPTIIGHDPNNPGMVDGTVGGEFPALPAAAQVMVGPQGQVSISLPDHLSEEERKQIAMQVLQQYSAYGHPITCGALSHGIEIQEGTHLEATVAHVPGAGEEGVDGATIMMPAGVGDGGHLQVGQQMQVEGVGVGGTLQMESLDGGQGTEQQIQIAAQPPPE